MEAWLAARKAGSTLSYLGLQDAARKRRDSSMTPGAWAGSLLRSDGGQVRILTSQEKWDRAKELIKETQDLLEADADAEYTEVIEINMDEIKEPILCCPNDPDDAKLLSEVQGDKVDEIFIGSCMTNIGHFRAAGKLLENNAYVIHSTSHF